MKITVLGRWGAYPEAGEATSGYLLETDRHKILLDCGSGVLSQLMKHIRPEELDAVFLSHFHYDHSADIGCLLYATRFAMAFKRRLEPLAVYANNQSARFTELSFREYTVAKAVNPETIVDLDGLKVTFLKTVHEEYNLAMRFEYNGKVLVYTGDLGPETNMAGFCSNADLILCETSLFEHESGLFPGHMTTREAAELAAQSRAKALLISHFPHSGSIAQMPKEAARHFNGAVYMAEIGKRFEV